jgi:peptide subunit release factor 1 (eRF1)
LAVEEVKDLADIITEKATSLGAKIEFISTDTREGIQFKELGGIGAFLRFKLS